MKKGLGIFLAVLMLLNVLCTGVFAEGEAPVSDYSLWVASDIQKVLKDQTPPQSTERILEFESAKNEYESAQLIITAGRSALDNISVSVSDAVYSVSDDVYAMIPASDIKIYVQHYINVDKTVTSVPAGWYPDALIPIEKYVEKHGKISVEPGQNQGLWFTVKIPKGIPAGIYNGEVSIEIDGITEKISMLIKVWDFELTDESHSKTAFAVWPDMFKFAYPGTDYESAGLSAEQKKQAKEKAYQLMGKYYQFLLDYRLTCTNLPFPTDDLDAYVENAKNYLAANPRITAYRIPYDNNNLDISKNTIKALNDNGILDKGYIYDVDEPYDTASMAHAMEVSDNILRIRDELGLSRLRNLITMDFNKKYYGKVNLWCPILTSFGANDFAEIAPERINQGDEVWWYTCVHPAYPFPSYHINDYAMGARLLSWMQKSYGIEGNLYWCTNIFGLFKESPWGYYERDVWNNAFAFPGAAGDGYLLYPGVEYGTDDPFPSIRLETIREGNEDYEYLWLLDQKVSAAAKDLGVSVTSDEILKPLYERLFKNVKDYTTDTSLLKEARREVAEMIMALDKNPKVLAILGDLTEDCTGKNVTVYAQPGTVVKVNDEIIEKTETAGNADKYEMIVPCNLGMNEFTLVGEKEGNSVILTPRFLVRSKAPEIYPVELYNAEVDSELSRWSIGLNETELPPMEHSKDFVTDGEQGLKVVFRGDGPDDWPSINLDLTQGGLYHTDWSKFKTIEFDCKNAGPELNWLYICIFDSEHNKYEQWSTLESGEQQHVSIPIKDIAAKIDINDVEIVRFYMGTVYMNEQDYVMYLDNLHFTAEQKFNKYPAKKAARVNSGDISIDGILDDASWAGRINNEIKEILGGTPNNKAKFSTLWDENYFYIAVDVEDDELVEPESEYPWDDDSIEIYIDGNMNKDAYDTSTVQYIFRCGDSEVHKGASNSMATTDGFIHKIVETEKGYSLEAAIPWESFNTTVQAGKYVGFTIHVNDRDGDEGSCLGLTKNLRGDWQNSYGWADIELIPNEIYYASEKMVEIDGNADEKIWNFDKELKLTAFGEPNNKARFATLWNEKYLYVAFDVKDDFAKNTGSANCWDDDSVEVFLDVNLTKGSYNAVSSTTVAQLTFKYDDGTVYVNGKPADEDSPVDGSKIIHGSAKTDSGYNVEIAIPWEAFGGSVVQAGKTIAITAHCNDKDTDDADAYGESCLGYSINNPPNVSTSENWPEFRLSPELATANDRTPPVWPEEAKLNASDITEESVQLTWPEASDDTGVTGYDVYANGKFVASVKKITALKVENLLPGTKYVFKVIAKDAINESTALKSEVITLGVKPLGKDIIVRKTAFKDSSDNIVTKLESGQDIYANLTIKNMNSIEAKNVLVIVALFDAHGNLEEMSYTSGEINSGETSDFGAGFKLPNNVAGKYIRVFVWDSMENLRPLSEFNQF